MRRTQQLRWTTDQELQPARGFDIYGLITCLAISAFLIVWITLASGSFNPRSALFLLVLPWALLRAGGIISAAIRLPSFFALDFLLGVAVASVVILAWKVFVPLPPSAPPAIRASRLKRFAGKRVYERIGKWRAESRATPNCEGR
jgi:hypothetical protein